MVVLVMLPMTTSALHLETRSHPRSISYEVIQYLGCSVNEKLRISAKPDLRSFSFGSHDSVREPEVWVDISPSVPREVGILPYKGSAFGGPLKKCRVFLGTLPLPLDSAARPEVEEVEGPA